MDATPGHASGEHGDSWTAVIVNKGSSANPISTKPKPHDLALNNPVHRHLFPPRQGLKRRKYRTQHTEVKTVCPS